MGAVRKPVGVVTADIINSRSYDAAARARLNEALRRAFNAIVPATNVALAHLDFRVTAGDEFQFVLGDPGRALETVFLMRSRLAQEPMEPMVRFRASIGVGPVQLPAGARRAREAVRVGWSGIRAGPRGSRAHEARSLDDGAHLGRVDRRAV